MSRRLYVGVTYENAYKKGTLFWNVTTPMNSTHGDRFAYVIGPFRTKRGAELCCETLNGVCAQTVSEWEELVRLERHEQ